MYGVVKKDIYSKSSKSKWIEERANLSMTDDNIDKSEFSFCEHNEKKNLFNDKLENILEYIKSIDSDTKNTHELISNINNTELISNIDNNISQLSTTMTNFLQKSQDDMDTNDIIKNLNTFNTGIKLKQDKIIQEIYTLKSNIDIITSNIEQVSSINTQLLNLINKLIIDNKHTKNELLQTNNKLIYITSHIEHIYDKLNIINYISSDKITENTKNETISTDNFIADNIINDITDIKKENVELNNDISMEDKPDVDILKCVDDNIENNGGNDNINDNEVAEKQEIFKIASTYKKSSQNKNKKK